MNRPPGEPAEMGLEWRASALRGVHRQPRQQLQGQGESSLAPRVPSTSLPRPHRPVGGGITAFGQSCVCESQG